MIEAQEIEFDPHVETPNVINTPMPDHGKSTNAVDNDSYVFAVNELTTSLMTVKKNLLQAGIFPGYFDNCRYCASEPNGCAWLKRSVQRLIDNRAVLFMKNPYVESLCGDVSKSLKIEDVSEANQKSGIPWGSQVGNWISW